MLGTNLFRALSQSYSALAASNISRYAVDANMLCVPKKAIDHDISDSGEKRHLLSPRGSASTKGRFFSGMPRVQPGVRRLSF